MVITIQIINEAKRWFLNIGLSLVVIFPVIGYLTQSSEFFSVTVQIAMLLGIVVAVITFNQQKQIQEDQLFDEIAKQERDVNRNFINYLLNKNEIEEKNKKLLELHKEEFCNFYEYLCFLINNEKVNKKDAIEFWKYNIDVIYKEFPKKFQDKRKELKKLVKSEYFKREVQKNDI